MTVQSDMQGVFQSPFDVHIVSALEASKKTHAREAMRSALQHLRLAEPLFEQDVAMAVFRCITAVEEAATSLMLLLQHKKYPRSDELKRSNHLYKNAVVPFIRILHTSVMRTAAEKNIHIDLLLNSNIKEALGVQIVVTAANGSSACLSANPPLDFLLTDEGLGIDKTLDIDAYLAGQGAQSVKAHLKQETNSRNLLLYATPRGVPRVSVDTDKFFPAYQHRVRVLLCAYLLIEPFGHQQAVTHCIDDYLALVALFARDKCQ